MKEENKMESNVMISEFMGAKREYNPHLFSDTWIFNPDTEEHWICTKDNINYDHSWTWLMDVVEKIEGLGYKVVMFSDETWIKGVFPTGEPLNRNIEIIGQNRLKNTYDAIVEFIEWYNQQPK